MNKLVDTPTTAPSSTQRAYLALRDAIITGKAQPGDRLKVEALKEELQTGASPVREALSLLTSDQLVERLDQRGFRVAKTSRAQFDEILELRCQLEVLALRQSIENLDSGSEDALVLAHHRMTKADRSQPHIFEALHKEFHMSLLAACKSPILLRFCEQLYDLNVRYRYLAGRAKSYGRRNVAAEHRAILDATVHRSVEVACEHLVQHYRRTGAFLAEQID